MKGLGPTISEECPLKIPKNDGEVCNSFETSLNFQFGIPENYRGSNVICLIEKVSFIHVMSGNLTNVCTRG